MGRTYTIPPVEQCWYRVTQVVAAEPYHRGWQSLTVLRGGIAIPPIEYTIRPGDVIEAWIRPVSVQAASGSEPRAGDEWCYFRINRIGRPIPMA